MGTKRYFERKMGFIGDAPENYHQLKNEILKWPRIGMKAADSEMKGGGSNVMFSSALSKYDKTGFVRKFELSHTYPGIDNDIERLVREGYLIELTHKDVLKKEIMDKGASGELAN